MADNKHVSILRSGVEAWNRWRMENPDVQPDLANADFEEENLVGANLSESILRRTNFVRANLNKATLLDANGEFGDFRWADFREADLTRANLSDADFHKVDLTAANMEGTNLTRSNFEDACLEGAKFAQAVFHQTRLFNTSLFGATGLSEAKHKGPSVIDEETLHRSEDLPKDFLKACGFTASQLALIEKPEYDLFLSYHSAQQPQAQKIYDLAMEKGLNAYLAPKELQGGDNFAEAIRQALRRSREVCLLVTKEALKSTWVATEWGAAWVLGKRITPLLLRCDVDELPDRLRPLQCKDFHELEGYLNEVRARRMAE